MRERCCLMNKYASWISRFHNLLFFLEILNDYSWNDKFPEFAPLNWLVSLQAILDADDCI